MKPAIKPPSPRGLDLFRLLANGMSVNEISDELGLAHSTIYNMLSYNYARIGMRNTQGAAAWYVRNVEMKGGAK